MARKMKDTDTEEELIEADEAGALSLSPTKRMSDYRVRVGRQEFNTKCSFDAVQGLEHLLSEAARLRLEGMWYPSCWSSDPTENSKEAPEGVGVRAGPPQHRGMSMGWRGTKQHQPPPLGRVIG